MGGINNLEERLQVIEVYEGPETHVSGPSAFGERFILNNVGSIVRSVGAFGRLTVVISWAPQTVAGEGILPAFLLALRMGSYTWHKPPL